MSVPVIGRLRLKVEVGANETSEPMPPRSSKVILPSTALTEAAIGALAVPVRVTDVWVAVKMPLAVRVVVPSTIRETSLPLFFQM